VIGKVLGALLLVALAGFYLAGASEHARNVNNFQSPR
jgi:hypothetical protein